MGTILEGIPIGTIAPSALLSLVALMYFTGKLVPERVVKQLIDQRDRLIASQDARISEQAAHNAVLTENNTLLRGQGAVTTQVVAALPGVVGSEGNT